jgi:hypothetical protein
MKNKDLETIADIMTSAQRTIAVEKFMKWLQVDTSNDEEKVSLFLTFLASYYTSPELRLLVQLNRKIADKSDEKYLNGYSEFGFDHSKTHLFEALHIDEEAGNNFKNLAEKIMRPLSGKLVKGKELEQTLLEILTDTNMGVVYKALLFILLFEYICDFKNNTKGDDTIVH